MEEEKLVPALEKAMQILTLLKDSSSAFLGVSEIAALLGHNKGTTFFLLKTLNYYGLVEKDLATSKYALGKGFESFAQSYARRAEDTSDFLEVGATMHKLCRENINFSMLRGSCNCVVASIPADDYSLRVDLPVGTSIPAITSSAGKALLSDLEDKALERIFDEQFSNYTDKTIADKHIFLAEVHQAREQGYAINRGEYENGICSVGAPIRNSTGNIVAAINIVVPETRFDKQVETKLIALVKKGAEELSKRRGYTPSQTV